MAIATGVVGRRFVTAVAAALQMAAQGRRATGGQVAQRPALPAGQRAPVTREELLAILPNHVRHFHRRPLGTNGGGHAGPLRLAGERLRNRQQIEQTRRATQPAGIDVNVVRGGAQVVMAEDRLQGDQIDAGFQQVRGVAVPQGVRRAAASSVRLVVRRPGTAVARSPGRASRRHILRETATPVVDAYASSHAVPAASAATRAPADPFVPCLGARSRPCGRLSNVGGAQVQELVQAQAAGVEDLQRRRCRPAGAALNSARPPPAPARWGGYAAVYRRGSGGLGRSGRGWCRRRSAGHTPFD